MFLFENISGYHQQLLSGETTCADAVSHYLDAIDAKKHLNAFVEVFTEEAIKTASILDERRRSGAQPKKLHGVVVAIKDVICYKGHQVTASSAILNGFHSLFTSTALQYLIDEEAIIIGNCNCDEFAMGSSNEHSVYGSVLNALDESRVPGGSSGGSAVAVQAGLCMCSLGSDTGGSVRQPADHCGIAGFKPGYGSISRYGLLAYASSFDQIGIFANSVEDIERLYDVMNVYDPMDSTMKQTVSAISQPGKKLKCCYFPQVLDHPSLDPEIRAQLQELQAEVIAKGHSISPVDFDLLEYIVPAYYVLTTAEASSNLSRYDGIRYGHRSSKNTEELDEFYKNNRSEGFGMEVKRRIMLGTFVLSSGYYDAYFTKAQKIRKLLVNKVKEIFTEFDVIIMPTVPATAAGFEKNAADPVAGYLADIFTVFANLTGIPGISIPLYTHSNKMPFGAQLMSATGQEHMLLDFAGELLKAKNNSSEVLQS